MVFRVIYRGKRYFLSIMDHCLILTDYWIWNLEYWLLMYLGRLSIGMALLLRRLLALSRRSMPFHLPVAGAVVINLPWRECALGSWDGPVLMIYTASSSTKFNRVQYRQAHRISEKAFESRMAPLASMARYRFWTDTLKTRSHDRDPLQW